VNELARIEKVMLLRSVDLFAHCRAEEVIRIAAIASQRDFAEGERIYEINEPADALYCVVEGSVRLDFEDASRSVGPGESFGMLGILSGRLRSVSAVAVEPTTALAVDAEDFFDLLSNNIDIVRALFREILQKKEDRLL
jgi:CRP-like cAMP-binding protein